ncbi:Hypothetical predicted protein [Olea europaea subsp. europaea]|uniref:Uncharacterized protein n=1 Tax=Olea europaea subsp. europaea TaxID=158383 RepID=A0A8S0UKK9_OLEEU|nr:Hypothetical predicted protein [Olea europaea subsp. europaea]
MSTYFSYVHQRNQGLHAERFPQSSSIFFQGDSTATDGDSKVIDGESKATDSIISPSLLHPSPPRCSAISFVKAFDGFFPDSNLQPPSSPTKSASKAEGCRRGADMRALRRQRCCPTSAFAGRRGADHSVYHLLCSALLRSCCLSISSSDAPSSYAEIFVEIKNCIKTMLVTSCTLAPSGEN